MQRLRRPLAAIALLIAAVKSVQVAIDHTPVFFSDSGAFIVNALGIEFLAFRSYVYGWLIRLVAVPTGSLSVLVVVQALMGGVVACMLAFGLMRYFAVRPWIAAGMALLFAVDPMQVVHEHLVMTEASAGFVWAAMLLTSLEYLRQQNLFWLTGVSVLGIVLVSLRTVYVPVVIILAVALPIAAYLRWDGRWPRIQDSRGLFRALLVSCAATLLCHASYRQLTGYLGNGEPAYHEREGLFTLAGVAPILIPEDSDLPAVAALIRQQVWSLPALKNETKRGEQLWSETGLIARIRQSFAGDEAAANREARNITRRAIRRNPTGYMRLAVMTYLRYWIYLRNLTWMLPIEHGVGETSLVSAKDTMLVTAHFGFDASNQYQLQTPSRRYHVLGRWWCLFLLSSPLFGLAAVWLAPTAQRTSWGILNLSGWLTMAAICFGSVEPVYRYLHPFSFTGLAAAGLLSDVFFRWLARVRLSRAAR